MIFKSELTNLNIEELYFLLNACSIIEEKGEDNEEICYLISELILSRLNKIISILSKLFIFDISREIVNILYNIPNIEKLKQEREKIKQKIKQNKNELEEKIKQAKIENEKLKEKFNLVFNNTQRWKSQ